MKNKLSYAFTMVEIVGVIVIFFLLLSISLSFIARSPSQHEAKMAAYSIKSIFSLASSFARASSKVYMIDTDMKIHPMLSIDDPIDNKPTDPHTMLPFKILSIYSVDFVDNALLFMSTGESYEIPIGLTAYLDLDHTVVSGDVNDHIIFKPDGSISASKWCDKILIRPDSNKNAFYFVDIGQGKSTGFVKVKSFKSENVS